ncbi:retinol dehydrogenase 12-like isoform X2 [Coregonus clupeaformis]|uniref:retinol dehydrogenase 12-like isoform X2 n=1 Tax=Coregonus clupeaformis TaxID=59861 RepID=UPI001E1C2F19|nr:retinol dehydrogenase 12-like isoform X2 [Coregonus clupeaformis]
MWKELTKNQLVKYGAVTTVTTICYVLLRKWIAGGVCRSRAKLHGRTVVITGANTGIGKETAWDMAMRGARVIMACRDLTRGEAAAAEIRSSTGNTNVVVQQLDLASLGSVRQFAREFIATETRLDILINNAGIMLCPKSLTVDGFESQFAVNHLGHFLLTNLLLDMLKASTPSRVINVSSIAHQGGKIHFEDLNFDKKGYNSVIAYKQSKLANLLFSRELARRTKAVLVCTTKIIQTNNVASKSGYNWCTVQRSLPHDVSECPHSKVSGPIPTLTPSGTGVTSYSLHPGVIRTELWRHSQSKYPTLSAMLSAPAWLLMKNPKEGAQTTIYCAVTEGLEEKSGCYFSDCQEKVPAPEGRDDLAALRLWGVSAGLVGLNKNN